MSGRGKIFLRVFLSVVKYSAFSENFAFNEKENLFFDSDESLDV